MIAVFYNSGVHWLYGLIAAAILALLFLAGKFPIPHPAVYLGAGLALWYCMMKSGVHPAIAGVLLAFVIPYSGNDKTMPSYRLQKALHIPVGYFVVPLFALANTGIILREGWLSQMTAKSSLGVIGGSVVGKPTAFCFFVGP